MLLAHLLLSARPRDIYPSALSRGGSIAQAPPLTNTIHNGYWILVLGPRRSACVDAMQWLACAVCATRRSGQVLQLGDF